MRFFFEVDSKPRKTRLTTGELFFSADNISAGSAIPVVQGQTTRDLNNQQIRMEEMGERFSVTEDSTHLLKKKQRGNSADL